MIKRRKINNIALVLHFLLKKLFNDSENAKIHIDSYANASYAKTNLIKYCNKIIH